MAKRKSRKARITDGKPNVEHNQNSAPLRDREKNAFQILLHHCIGLKSSPLSVPILAQPHESIEASASRFGRARQDRQPLTPCLSRSDCKFLQSLATN